jgi:CYTH domain-containing protein
MPIENERKYVLRLDTPEKAFSDVADTVEDIEQMYLMFGKRQSVRIRKTLIFYPNKYCEWKSSFTFKQDIGKKTVEVETPLSREDYDLLKREAILKFRKWRYRIGDWEVDFFKSGDKTYFVQAEIELSENKRKPDELHPLVQENLIHVVKRGDGRFSSKKLGDAKYARRLLDTLLLETKV